MMERGTGSCNYFIYIDSLQYILFHSHFLNAIDIFTSSFDLRRASFNFSEFIVALHGRERITIDIYTLISSFSFAVGVLTYFSSMFAFDLPGNIRLTSVF